MSNIPYIKHIMERSAQYSLSAMPIEDLFTIILTGHGTLKQRSEALCYIQRWLRGRQKDGTLLATDVEDLLAVGFEESFACRLVGLLELVRRLSVPGEKPYTIKSPRDAANLVMAEMQHLKHEQMRVVVLDSRNQVLLNQVMYTGTINSSVLRVAELFRPAVTRNAPAILIYHNHPSGDPSPSLEDIACTELMVQAGKVLEIELVDHLVIGAGHYASLKDMLRW